ncbi:TetR family transcriptional regulator [Nonomuraea sp. NPDC050663]|uniref:TetR family transcriptional regulator n=1 Tax=Nonomuraea sp. NPDC050663 TaxID=3364370 RepID=UPI0037AAB721
MEEGLRERKKRETRERISDVATGLFMARGFEEVTIAEIAKAADVSVNTVFNYFGTKEDLFLDRQEEVEDVPARVALSRAEGESVVAAFRRDFLAAIETRDWRYGMNDGAAEFGRIMARSPSLQSRLREIELRRADRLARVLAAQTGAGEDDLRPRLVAGQILETALLLTRFMWLRLMSGHSWEEVRPWLREQAKAAFDLLEGGLGDFGV